MMFLESGDKKALAHPSAWKVEPWDHGEFIVSEVAGLSALFRCGSH